MGLYVPMNRYARNDDCFSLLLARADVFIQWHRFFDDFPYKTFFLVKFGLTMLLGVYNMLKPVTTCIA